jgi:anti-sigma-K factor RskA
VTTADLHTLTGAYALHALSDRESEEFALHLAACAACTQEVRELQETASRLALAAAEPPSSDFRARVMAAITEVRQLPPLVPDDPGHRAPSRWRQWRHRLPQLALAACLVVAMVAVGVAVDAESQVQQQRSQTASAQQQSATLSELLSAPDATFHSGRLTGGGDSTVVASQELGQAAFVYHGLPALPGSKVYELWYSKGGVMVPAGLVNASVPNGVKVLGGSPAGAAGVGVTVEPAGGSPRPTTSPILLTPLPAT